MKERFHRTALLIEADEYVQSNFNKALLPTIARGGIPVAHGVHGHKSIPDLATDLPDSNHMINALLI
jgi:hypothetical protein